MEVEDDGGVCEWIFLEKSKIVWEENGTSQNQYTKPIGKFWSDLRHRSQGRDK